MKYCCLSTGFFFVSCLFFCVEVQPHSRIPPPFFTEEPAGACMEMRVLRAIDIVLPRGSEAGIFFFDARM